MVEKVNLYFCDFLMTLSEDPISLQFKEIAWALEICESTLSKLRHRKMKRIPASLLPEQRSQAFVTQICLKFTQTLFTVRQFSIYFLQLKENFQLTQEILQKIAEFEEAVRTVTKVQAAALFNKNVCVLLQMIYEESYNNSITQQERITQKSTTMEADFKRLCDVIDRDVFDENMLHRLTNVINSAKMKHQVATCLQDESIIKMAGRYLAENRDAPTYKSVRKKEIVSMSEDGQFITRKVESHEQIIISTRSPVSFQLKWSFYYEDHPTAERLFQKYLRNFQFRINGTPFEEYYRAYTEAEKVSVLTYLHLFEEVDRIVTLAFEVKIHPAADGLPVNVDFSYELETPFYHNISCNYYFSLQYICKFLEHIYILDEKIKKIWGMHVTLFTPFTNSYYSASSRNVLQFQGQKEQESKRITFYDWSMPGSGYVWNLYKLEETIGKP